MQKKYKKVIFWGTISLFSLVVLPLILSFIDKVRPWWFPFVLVYSFVAIVGLFTLLFWGLKKFAEWAEK